MQIIAKFSNGFGCARLSQRHYSLVSVPPNLVRGFSAWLKINRSNLYLGALREQHRCEFSGTQHTFLFFSFNSWETYRACDLCCIHSRMLTQQADHQLFLVTQFCCSTVEVYHSFMSLNTHPTKKGSLKKKFFSCSILINNNNMACCLSLTYIE